MHNNFMTSHKDARGVFSVVPCSRSRQLGAACCALPLLAILALVVESEILVYSRAADVCRWPDSASHDADLVQRGPNLRSTAVGPDAGARPIRGSALKGAATTEGQNSDARVPRATASNESETHQTVLPLRLLVTSDPQLQGRLWERPLGPWGSPRPGSRGDGGWARVFLSGLERWVQRVTLADADGYLDSALGALTRALRPKPAAVLVLGDLLDEGYAAAPRDFARYASRFWSIFRFPLPASAENAPASSGEPTPRGTPYIPVVAIPGDNDVGGEGTDRLTRRHAERFAAAFSPFRSAQDGDAQDGDVQDGDAQDGDGRTLSFGAAPSAPSDGAASDADIAGGFAVGVERDESNYAFELPRPRRDGHPSESAESAESEDARAGSRTQRVRFVVVDTLSLTLCDGVRGDGAVGPGLDRPDSRREAEAIAEKRRERAVRFAERAGRAHRAQGSARGTAVDAASREGHDAGTGAAARSMRPGGGANSEFRGERGVRERAISRVRSHAPPHAAPPHAAPPRGTQDLMFGSAPPAPQDEARVPLVLLSHVPLAQLCPRWRDRLMRALRPDAVLAGHTHASALHSHAGISNVSPVGPALSSRGGEGSRRVRETFSQRVPEIVAPTCSYRMGTKRIGAILLSVRPAVRPSVRSRSGASDPVVSGAREGARGTRDGPWAAGQALEPSRPLLRASLEIGSRHKSPSDGAYPAVVLEAVECAFPDRYAALSRYARAAIVLVLWSISGLALCVCRRGRARVDARDPAEAV
jgi:hypothetical protein